MDPVTAGVIAATAAIALLGLVVAIFGLRDRREAARRTPTGTTVDSRSPLRRVRPDRSGRLIVGGMITCALGIGVIIGILSTYILFWFGWR